MSIQDQNIAGDPPETEEVELRFSNQINPRVRVWQETIKLLRASEVPDNPIPVTAFVNEATQYVIRSGEAKRPNLDDLAALGAGINARSRELNLTLLEITGMLNDIAIITEFAGVLAPFREELRKEMSK